MSEAEAYPTASVAVELAEDAPSLRASFQSATFGVQVCYTRLMIEKSASKDDIATRIMTAMVRMPPEPHKDAPKPLTAKGKAQRRRRENERQDAARS